MIRKPGLCTPSRRDLHGTHPKAWTTSRIIQWLDDRRVDGIPTTNVRVIVPRRAPSDIATLQTPCCDGAGDEAPNERPPSTTRRRASFPGPAYPTPPALQPQRDTTGAERQKSDQPEDESLTAASAFRTSLQQTVEWCRTAPTPAVVEWVRDAAPHPPHGKIANHFAASLVKAAIKGRLLEVPDEASYLGDSTLQQRATRAIVDAESRALRINTALRLHARSREIRRTLAALPENTPPSVWVVPAPPKATSAPMRPSIQMAAFRSLAAPTAKEIRAASRYRSPFARDTAAAVR